MGMITIKKYVCDCCGRESERDDFNTGSVSGSGNLTLSGNEGGMAYNGDWGGGSYELKMLLCFSCSTKIREAISEIKKSKRQQC